MRNFLKTSENLFFIYNVTFRITNIVLFLITVN
nr:MAG TPA: hypothetical protein [Caudoviricetes sp.]